MDRFADGENHLLRRFNSRYGAPAAEAVDAFSVSWSDDTNWPQPPLAALTCVVGKLREDRARGTLIVRRWTGAPARIVRRERGSKESRVDLAVDGLDDPADREIG